MDEFNNRIDAQRTVLQIVNRRFKGNEQLFGLSRKAIERWVVANRRDPRDELSSLLQAISEKLLFLANRSQEQISDEYQGLSSEVEHLTSKLAKLAP